MNICFVVCGSPSSTDARVKRIKQFAQLNNSISDSNKSIILFIDETSNFAVLEEQQYPDFIGINVGSKFFRNALLKKFFQNYINGLAAMRALPVIYSQILFTGIFSYGQSYLFQKSILKFAHIHNIKAVIDLTEWLGTSIKSLFSPNHWDHLFFCKFYVKYFYGAVCISNFWQEYLTKELKFTNHELIPAMSSISISENKSFQSTKVLKVTYLGILAERDCPFEMIDGFIEVAQSSDRYEFHIAGSVIPRMQRVFEDKIKKYHLQDKIIFTGWLSNKDLDQLFSTTDIFILLRKQNKTSIACFPTRIPEYLEANKVLITSGISSLKPYFRNNIDAIILDPANHQREQLASILLRIENNFEYIKDMKLNAGQLSNKVFYFQNFKDKFRSLYK